MNLLAISSSQSTQSSVSSGLVNHFVETYSSLSGSGTVVRNDIGETPPPHVDGVFNQAIFTPADQLSTDQKQSLVQSDQYIAELQAADVIVIGAPMHNFSISSPLKTWIDHVVRAGQTFSYGENGPQGLLSDKKVFVLTARGGDYSEGGFMHAMDHQEPYLRFVLGFIGLDDVTFVHAQGLAMGDEAREQAISKAQTDIESHVAALSPESTSVAA